SRECKKNRRPIKYLSIYALVTCAQSAHTSSAKLPITTTTSMPVTCCNILLTSMLRCICIAGTQGALARHNELSFSGANCSSLFVWVCQHGKLDYRIRDGRSGYSGESEFRPGFPQQSTHGL